MDQKGISVSTSNLYGLLQGCINKKDLALGREVQRIIRRNGFESDSFIGSHLIRMFASCGRLLEAQDVFNRISNPNVFAWGAIISAHAKLGQSDQAIDLYHKMQLSELKPDGHVFVAVIKACASIASLTKGKFIHAHMIKSGFESNVFVSNVLIDMYAKSGSLEDAQTIFNNLAEQTLVTWSAMVAGYVLHGHPTKALQLFQRMQQKGLKADNVMFVSVLKACSSLTCLNQGKLIHKHIIESGMDLDVVIESTLIDMYAKRGNLKDARRLFERMPKRDAVTWNAMIAGYANGSDQEAFKLFQRMQEEGVEPDQVTCISVLQACSSTLSLHQGKLIHGKLINGGFESSALVGSSLIDMYTKCGSIEDASRVFDKLSEHDVVTWSAMIGGLTCAGHVQEAFQLVQKMRQEEIKPNTVTFACILKACSSIAALDQGKLIYVDIIESGCELDVVVASSLIDMFAKCGNLEDASKLFGSLPKHDLVVWNCIMAGCAQHSNFKLALRCFEHMQRAGLKPDDASVVALLSACCHLGLVDKGCYEFNLLREHHGIEPTLDHYNCMVDLLGRAGLLHEAEGILQIMPFQDNIVGWTTLLSHCKTHGSLEQGQRCFDQVVALDDSYSAVYVLMSGMYAHAGMWEDAEKLEELRKSVSAWKKPGQAFVEVGSNIYNFTIGDTHHPESDDIYAKLSRLRWQMEHGGYTPQLDLVLHSLSDELESLQEMDDSFLPISTLEKGMSILSKNLRVHAD